MNNQKKDLALLFSNGEFENVFKNLDENIVWTIYGQNIFKGKDAVILNCIQTAKYFKTVDTLFKTEKIIQTESTVIITGNGEFKREGKRLNYVDSCDIYTFNENDNIVEITSYCVVEND